MQSRDGAEERQGERETVDRMQNLHPERRYSGFQVQDHLGITSFQHLTPGELSVARNLAT